MIIGVGTDIVQISRIERSLAQYGAEFAKRILTPDELSHFFEHKNQVTFVAARFAAKEAAVKALGTGFSEGLGFSQIGVANDPKGKPEIYFLGKAYALYQQKNILAAHLSLTHEKEYALAFVVLEG